MPASQVFDEVLVLDCRFPFEFAGGHIKGAVNTWTPDHLLRKLFLDTHPGPHHRTAIIVHCEFSSNRGPAQLALIRNIDRQINLACYPELWYPSL